jgi:hypothetical protein
VEKVLHVLAVFSVFVSFVVTRSLVTDQTAMQIIGCLKIKSMNPGNGISRGLLTWWLIKDRWIECNRKETVRKNEEYKFNRL